MRDFTVAFITILVLTSLAFYAGRKTAENGAIETVERVDTLVIRDTIVSYRPKYIARKVVDSVYVPVTEYITERDTVFAILEREQVTWEDSLARIYASGIRPEIDSVFHYRTERVITQTFPVKVPYRWGIGIQGGVGVGKGGLTPYVGIGVNYNLLSW